MFSKPLIFQLPDNEFLYVIPLPSLKYFVLSYRGVVLRTYSFDALFYDRILSYNARDWFNALEYFTFIELAKY